MALESTSIKDGEGAALYILHTGGVLASQQLDHLAGEIKERTGHEIHLLDIDTQDGEKVRDFYDIAVSDLPAILIVRDDDTLSNVWTKDQLPDPDTISYALNQVSHG